MPYTLPYTNVLRRVAQRKFHAFASPPIVIAAGLSSKSGFLRFESTTSTKSKVRFIRTVNPEPDETKMKRKATSESPQKPKKQAIEVSEYCDTPPKRDDQGIVWPAGRNAMENARQFLRDCAAANETTIIVPDKDADGLSSGVILHRTLQMMGLPKEKLHVHLLGKGTIVHDEEERLKMEELKPKFVIVLDQGSRPAPRIVNGDARCLIIDHHLSDVFPEDSEVVSACHFPPVATSALLTYMICCDLHPDVERKCAYLCAIGTMGDLGTSLKWRPPFPNLGWCFKEYSKQTLNKVVSLINAPRRTAKYDVITAWNALFDAENPEDILKNTRLLNARAEINEEVERRTHVPPKFSADGKVAVLRLHSEAQVHPVIATRWAGHLKSSALEIVLVANSGYLPEKGLVNFSCRVAKCARSKDPPVNIIESLKAYAEAADADPLMLVDGNDSDRNGEEMDGANDEKSKAAVKDIAEDQAPRRPLIERLGHSFAQGHKEASGGIVPLEAFEELMKAMKVGETTRKKKEKKEETSPQKNNLMNYFAKGKAVKATS